MEKIIQLYNRIEAIIRYSLIIDEYENIMNIIENDG